MYRLTLTCLVLGLVVSIGAVQEESFAKLKAMNNPSVALIGNPTSDGYEQAKKILVEAEQRLPSFQYYTCDVRKRNNARAAKAAHLNEDAHIFVRTREDGIEEFRLPVNLRNLVRYLNLRGVAGDPNDIVNFVSEEHLFEEIDRLGLPIFVKFYEPWCSHCVRMQRGFEAGATFFKNRVQFMQVQCSLNTETQSFCAKYNVDLFPTLKLFTGKSVVGYQGSRAVAGYELFFHENRELFNANEFNVGKDLTQEEQNLIGSDFPTQEADIGKPDTSAQKLVGDDLITQGASRANDDDDEEMVTNEFEVDSLGKQRKLQPHRRSQRTTSKSMSENEHLKTEIDTLKDELASLKDMMKELLARK